MLHETMPRLTKLRIDKSSQMNLTVASRFRDVTDICINSLLKQVVQNAGMGEDEFKEVEVDFDTKIRVVPFLSHFKPTLERVHFGGKDEAGEDIVGFAPAAQIFWEGEDGYPNDGDRESMLAFIDMISGAFSCGALSKHLKISGLCCPDTTNRRFGSGQCSTCQRACKSFPLESVIHFENEGSSVNNARSGRSYGLDVCLQVGQIESIIESRPGGKELLRTEERLLRLLGSGRLYKIMSGNVGGAALYIVKYPNNGTMKRVIKYADLDVKKLSTQILHDAILKSFVKDGASIPPKNQRYLSEESLVHLRDEVGLCIDEEGISGNLIDLVEYTEQIASVLREASEGGSENWEYEDIWIDCLKLTRRIHELENPPIHHFVATIPSLAIWLGGLYAPEYKMEAASIVKNIYAKGTEEHKKMVIDAGVIPKICGMLGSTNDSVVKSATLALVDIVTGEKKEHIDSMVEAGPSTPQLLANLLDSSDNVCIESSLRLLAVAARDHAQSAIDGGVLSPLFRLMKAPGQTDVILANCSILLCKIFEADNPPIQQVIDAKLVPWLVEILEIHDNDNIGTNLAHVCIGLASGGRFDSLVKEAGFLAALVRLQDSSNDTVSEKATSCLEDIANERSSYHVESSNTLAWGEYRMLQLVDSDDEEGSTFSAEEAVEVGDEQVKLEEEQAIAANALTYVEFTGPWVNDEEESPSLLGVPKHLLENILIYATKTQVEVNVLETVCKKFHMIVKSNDDGDEFRRRHPSLYDLKTTVGLRLIRKYQKSADNEIMNVLCGDQLALCGGGGDKEVSEEEEICANVLCTVATNILSRMNHLGRGSPSFRLRGDTVGYLFELCQAHLIERLEQALLLAIHSSRTEVQSQDFVLLPSHEALSGCNIAANDHGNAKFSFTCSCSLSSSSGIVWRWPEDNCRDVLPPDAGRRIIRRLACKAGINQMTSSAFDVAEVELLHTLGILVVEAYESSVQMAKNARFLDPEEPLLYGINPDSTVDMFYVPPPPFCDEDSRDIIYTIVPGQISAAAQRRNIQPHKVYGRWSFHEVEESYYYEPCHRECSDSQTSDDKSRTSDDNGGDDGIIDLCD